jgi:hypothetical protein
MEQLLVKMDSEAQNRFKKPWTKLDKGCKLNRLSQYVKHQKAENNLTDDQEKRLKILLFQLCETSALNKCSDVLYDTDDTKILEINNLEHNQKDNTYTFKKPSKKSKHTPSKSKGNIEKHFSRSL